MQIKTRSWIGSFSYSFLIVDRSLYRFYAVDPSEGFREKDYYRKHLESSNYHEEGKIKHGKLTEDCVVTHGTGASEGDSRISEGPYDGGYGCSHIEIIQAYYQEREEQHHEI